MPFSAFLTSLVFDGIVPGISSVLSFIPSIALLIFIISFLKESGIFKGDLAPLFMGFSCSVPAIIACGLIENKRRKYVTMFMVPYMSCSAKLPVYVMLASAFFPGFKYAAIAAVYLAGILIAAAAMRISGCFKLPSSFDDIRIKPTCPCMKNVFSSVYICCIGFVKKAFTIIIAASIIIWLLKNLDTSFHMTCHIEESLLAFLGRAITPVLSPLGFGSWEAAAALITGLSAKEAIVSTLAVISSNAGGTALCISLQEIFTEASAASFMVFCLLYAPCPATLAAIKNITGKAYVSVCVFLGQTIVAWLVSFLIFNAIKVII